MNLLLKVQLIRRNIIIIIVNLCSSIELPQKGFVSVYVWMPCNNTETNDNLYFFFWLCSLSGGRSTLPALKETLLRGQRWNSLKTDQTAKDKGRKEILSAHVNNISDLQNGNLFNQSGIASQTKLFCTPWQKKGAFTKEKTGPCID